MENSNRYVKCKYPMIRKNLLELNSPEFLYILGYFWADGWIDVKETCERSRERNNIGFSISKSDFETIRECFNKTGEWRTHELIRKHRVIQNKYYQPVTVARIYGRELVDLFTKYGFREKSNTSPSKILTFIPENLHFYFWRGYIDGDGYVGKHRVTITSCKEHDWKYCTDYFNNLGISSGISTTGHYSSIVFTDRQNICRLFEFLYPTGYDFGLKRKYSNFDEIRNHVKKAMTYLSTKSEKFICEFKRGEKSYYLFSISRKECKHQKLFKNKNDAIKYRDDFLSEHKIVGYSITGNRYT